MSYNARDGLRDGLDDAGWSEFCPCDRTFGCREEDELEGKDSDYIARLRSYHEQQVAAGDADRWASYWVAPDRDFFTESLYLAAHRQATEYGRDVGDW